MLSRVGWAGSPSLEVLAVYGARLPLRFPPETSAPERPVSSLLRKLAQETHPTLPPSLIAARVEQTSAKATRSVAYLLGSCSDGSTWQSLPWPKRWTSVSPPRHTEPIPA